MRIILSAAISADGYLDDFERERLILSSPEDWRAIYALRAECDAILVGAGTLREDNPALVIRDPKLRKKRLAEGRPADIMKVTVSSSGRLDPKLRFFTEGAGEKVIFTTGVVSNELSEVATIISRPEITSPIILEQLLKMGVNSVMVEGGSAVLSMFLREKSWDEFRLGVAPVFVGDERAPRLVLDGEYSPMTLVRTERLGQTAVLHFVNRSQYRIDCSFVSRALHNNNKCESVAERYRVGAVLVTLDGREYDGHTGETDPANHAEEEVLAKALADGADLNGATIYSTIEPCTSRTSKPDSCTDLIIRHGLSRVVFALREPDRFVRCDSVRRLSEAGIEVTEIPAFAGEVIRLNSHILKR
ncbi:MAG: dihydrofolate reductase family protein [Alistipes sp.]|jgi:5-amino-6-(5-phosphoribosylamino)uracil reductase|nr:dihydrofolate reductase family protein [Alistipes sp.]